MVPDFYKLLCPAFLLTQAMEGVILPVRLVRRHRALGRRYFVVFDFAKYCIFLSLLHSVVILENVRRDIVRLNRFVNVCKRNSDEL